MYRTSSSSSCSYGDNQEGPFNHPCLFISSNQTVPINNGHFPSTYINPSQTSYSSSFPSSSYDNYLHRSNSSQSLPVNNYMQEFVPKSSVFSSSSPSSSPCCDFLYSAGPMSVRRVFSTGDLQGMNGPQSPVENSNNQEICGPGGTGKVVRYTAEERKERIEKYRSKRNHRNFQKKITYACRKTLADSRPRVKGRFARNGEIEVEAESEMSGTNNESFNYNNGFNNYNISNGITSKNHEEWWRQIEETLEVEDEEGETSFYDEQMWALLSMNLLSENLV